MVGDSIGRFEATEKREFAVNGIAFSSDGKLCATSDIERQLRIWRDGKVALSADLASKNPKVRTSDRVHALRFEPSGHRLLIASGDTLLRMSAETGEIDWSYVPPRMWGFIVTAPLGIALDGDGLLAAGFDNGSMALWNADLSPVRQWSENDAPRSMSYSPDGNLVYGSDGFSICAWDAANGRKVRRIQLLFRAYGFAASPTADVVAVRALARIHLFDMDSGQQTMELPCGPGLPLAAFSPDGSTLAYVTTGGVELYDLAGGGKELLLVPERIVAMGYAPSGENLAVGLDNGMVRHLDVAAS